MEELAGKQKEKKKSCNVEVGCRLRRIMDKKGIQPIEFAAALNMSRSNAGKIFNGTQGLNAEKMRDIYEELDIAPNDYMLSEEERSHIYTLDAHIREVQNILETMPHERRRDYLQHYFNLIMDGFKKIDIS